MAARKYIPSAGDIVWLDFDPQAGREQSGHRPALVISASEYNRVTGLMVCCPMTTRIKGYPFEVAVNDGGVDSVVLADQVKSMDWRTRALKFKSKAKPSVLKQTRAKLKLMLQMD